MPSEDEKIRNKITSGSVKYIFCERKSKTMFPLKDLWNQDDSFCKFIKSKTKDPRIKEHKLYLSNHKCHITNDMNNLPVM